MASKDIASKYKDIISKRIRIQSGPPAVYQLKTNKEKFGTLTRMTVGEKNPNKTNRTILLVGETGAGKSTLVNALVNYTMGVKWEDEVWFQIVEEEEKSLADSQTSDVIMYEIFGFEDETLPYSLTIIDTPGYGDTRGIENDVIVSQRLLDLFRSEAGVHELHSVGLVMKATDNRVSDRLMYIFNSVMSLFGKNLEKNIVVLLTHSNGRKPKNVLDAIKAAKIKCANIDNEPVYFLFNNSRDEEETGEGEELVYAQYIYQISMKGMKEFMKFLEKSASQKLMTTAEVLNERSRLTASVANLQEKIKLTEMKQTEIRQIQDALKNNQDETKKNENFIAEVDEVYKDKEDIDGGMWLFYYGGAVCCTVCEENCHYPGCTLAWKPAHCEVMKRGRCTVCSGKCPVADHVKEKWRYVNKTRKVQKTMEDVKEKYENNKIESEKNLSLLETLEKKMKQLTAEKSLFLDDSYQHVVRLEQIALKADSASTIVHLDFLIEKMKEKGDTEKGKQLEEMRSRVDEGSRAALRYRFANLNFFCRVTNSSSKYKDIISKSIQIRSGPPAVYQLTTKKEKFGTLTRMIVGEKNPNKTNRTILLVGETGAGKSTLVNALTNYTMGVKWEDEVWFQIVEREKNKCQTESQTSDVIVYEIFGFEDETLPYSLTIIDTPGFGDTSDIEYDNAFQKFLELFQLEEGVYEVNAVGLVMKATDNRLSDRLMYVFNIVMSLFGKNLEEKIVALITHSEGRNPKNALDALQVGKIRCYKKKKNQPVYFLFDNCQNEDRTGEEEGMKYAKYADQISMKGMKDLTDFLEKSASKKLMTTVDVLKERIRLTACIQNLQQKIILTELKQTEFKQTQDALKKYGEMKKNEGFTVEVDEVHKQKEDIDGGMWGFIFYEAAVCCTVCEETCHYPGCTMAWTPEYCEVMKEGHCTVCTNKCPESDHVKEKWRYVNKTSKVQKTMEDLKEKYNNGKKTQGPNESSLLQKLEMEMEKLTAEESQFLDESYHHVVRLEQIALKADSVSTVVHLDFLIKKMKARKEDEDDEKVQKLEEIRKNMDEGTRAALRYRQDS